jgi:beta-1,4-mannosyltransferase
MRFYRALPPPSKENPFQYLLAEELELLGWKHLDFKAWRVFELLKYKDRVEVLYYHWPEAFWRTNYKPVMLLKAFQFIVSNSVARILGYHLVFSIHNVMPHKTNWLRLEFWMRQWIFNNFDGFIGHSNSTLDEIKARFNFNSEKYKLAHHGLYNDYYKEISSSVNHRIEAVLTKAKKHSIRVVLFANKHHLQDVEEFILDFQERGNSEIAVIVVGNSSKDLSRKYSDLTNLYFYKDFLPDNNLDYLLNSVQAIVIPYRKITTSGIAFLACTYFKPVFCIESLPFFTSFDPKKLLVRDLTLLFRSELNNEMIKVNREEIRSSYFHIYSWQLSAAIISKIFSHNEGSPSK